MDYLWTPGATPTFPPPTKPLGCVFCDAVKAGDDEKARIVYRGQQCFVILNAYPYTPGHVMIVPYEHLDELQKLPSEAASEMMALSQRMESVLRELYQPDGINLGHEHRQSRRRRHRRTHPHARPATLGGGCELHVGSRRDAGAPGNAGADVEADDNGAEGGAP